MPYEIFLLIVQAVPASANDVALLIEHADRITLAGALVMGVIVLWRALSSKDIQLLATVKTVTEALALTSSSNSELRRIIEESVRSKDSLSTQIEELRKVLVSILSLRPL